MADITIGEFEVLGNLGQGANSTILHIRRKDDARPYALKVVPIRGKDEHKFIDQAEYEYRIAGMLNHDNLIKIYTLEKKKTLLGRTKEIRLLVEYVNGRTLDDFRRIPIATLVSIFFQVARGLDHMHQREVFHADIKPNNILISKKGRVKIIDYGLAWVKGENKERVQGTPEYMAPEQARDKIVNEQTDIYNLGATMYRMVTWRTLPSPIANRGVLTAKNWDRFVKRVVDCNPETPKPLAELIHQCIGFKPDQRPGRMKEVRAALKEMAQRTGEETLENADELAT